VIREPELGVRVVARDVDTLDELADVHAPMPVEPGDVLADELELYVVSVTLVVPPGTLCVPVLARRAEWIDHSSGMRL
jgi:hypothetical protein